jgi:hypothetical protein
MYRRAIRVRVNVGQETHFLRHDAETKNIAWVSSGNAWSWISRPAAEPERRWSEWPGRSRSRPGDGAGQAGNGAAKLPARWRPALPPCCWMNLFAGSIRLPTFNDIRDLVKIS